MAGLMYNENFDPGLPGGLSPFKRRVKKTRKHTLVRTTPIQYCSDELRSPFRRVASANPLGGRAAEVAARRVPQVAFKKSF